MAESAAGWPGCVAGVSLDGAMRLNQLSTSPAETLATSLRAVAAVRPIYFVWREICSTVYHHVIVHPICPRQNVYQGTQQDTGIVSVAGDKKHPFCTKNKKEKRRCCTTDTPNIYLYHSSGFRGKKNAYMLRNPSAKTNGADCPFYFPCLACFSSSSRSAFSLLAAASCIASSRGSRSTHCMYHPFSVSSATTLPICHFIDQQGPEKQIQKKREKQIYIILRQGRAMPLPSEC